MVLYIFSLTKENTMFTNSLAALVERTFREYYKGEDIDIEVIGNGIDLVWKGEVSGFFNEDNKNGFCTIYTADSGINSPINNLEEADILACKIATVIYDYVKERDSKL